MLVVIPVTSFLFKMFPFFAFRDMDEQCTDNGCRHGGCETELPD